MVKYVLQLIFLHSASHSTQHNAAPIRLRERSTILDSLLELAQVRGAQTSDGIPAAGSRETISVAARVATRGNVVEAGASLAVQPGVEETQRSLALGQEVVVEQSNNGSKRGRSSTGAADVLVVASDDSLEVLSLGGNIRDTTSLGVVQSRVLGTNAGNVLGGGRRLVVGSSVVFRETARRETSGCLRSTLSSTDSGDPGATGGDCSIRVSKI